MSSAQSRQTSDPPGPPLGRLAWLAVGLVSVAAAFQVLSLAPPQFSVFSGLPALVAVPALPDLLPRPAVPLLGVPSEAAMGHLPDWVQTGQPAGLMSGPDKNAVRFTTLPAWSFLKVVGVQADRLQVEYAGDGGQRQAGPGWVALDDVQPSDPSGSWLLNHRATRLVMAAAVTPVPQWSPMLILDATGADRVRVRVYSTDYKNVVGEGWVPLADVGPTDPPDGPVTTRSVQAPSSPFADRDAFIAQIGDAARASQTLTGVPASVTVAQAILESDWGDSVLSRQANNYFGIKAMGQVGNDGAVWLRTMEYDAHGSAYYTLAPFRAYKTLVDGVTDHSQLFVRLPLYRAAMQAAATPDEFARRITAAGYSTDPAYATKLIGLMVKYNLYRFDKS